LVDFEALEVILLKVCKNTKNKPARNLGLPRILYLYARNFEMVKSSAWFLFFLMLAAACLDEPDCFHLNNDFIGITFKKLADSRIDTVGYALIGTVQPPLIFYGDTAISRLTLPLNYFEDETTFFFESEDTVRVLRLGYISQAQFVSENCGEKFVLSRLRVLEHSFDSVRLVRDVPTAEVGATHIEIFQ
jgi:hypothetical protein